MKNEDSCGFKFSIYNEISHLFSTSNWIYDCDNNIMSRISGIDLEEYKYKEDEGINISKLETFLNEFLNDFIAEKLFEEIEGKKYNGKHMTKSKEMLKQINELKRLLHISFVMMYIIKRILI